MSIKKSCFSGKIALPHDLKENYVQALQYEVEDGVNYLVKVDNKVMQLYKAEDPATPLEAIGMKNFPKDNFFAGHFGASQRAERVFEFAKNFKIGIQAGPTGVEATLGFNE